MAEHGNRSEEEQIDEIEDRLAGTLRRVAPPADFVTRLRGHVRMPEARVMVVRLYDWERLLVVIGGVLSGTVAVLTLARAMYYLLGRRS